MKKRQTIKDIAQLAGVSTATISRVLNNKADVSEEVRERVMQIITATNFSPRQMSSPHNIIGITVEYRDALSSRYVSNILRAAEEMAFEAGYNLLILRNEQLRKHGAHVTVHLKQALLSGIIVLLSQTDDTFFRQLAKDGFPHVIVSNRPAGDINYVDADARSGTREAVRYLAGLGHQRIALHLPSAAHFGDQERIAGYREGIAAAGLPVEEKLIVCHSLAGSQPEPPLPEGLQRLLDQHPTALITDCTTGGDLQQLDELGLHMPQDLSVVAYADTLEREMHGHRLTVIAQDAGELGWMAARSVINQTRGRAGMLPYRAVLATRLILGDTTGPPSKSDSAKELAEA